MAIQYQAPMQGSGGYGGGEIMPRHTDWKPPEQAQPPVTETAPEQAPDSAPPPETADAEAPPVAPAAQPGMDEAQKREFAATFGVNPKFL